MQKLGCFKDSLTTASVTGIHVTTSRARTQVTRRTTGNRRNNPRAALLDVAAALGRIVSGLFSSSFSSSVLAPFPCYFLSFVYLCRREHADAGRPSEI